MYNGLTHKNWQRVRAMVKARDGATCQYCGRYAPDGRADHVLSLSRGGTDGLTNLVWACLDCNRLKGDKTLREWALEIFAGRRFAELLPGMGQVEIVEVPSGEDSTCEG